MSRKRRKRKKRSSRVTRSAPPKSGEAPAGTLPNKAHGAGAAGLEPWARVGYGLVILGVLLFIVVASRPGGRLAIACYRFGPTLLGLAIALNLAYGLLRSILSRPVLQRGRLGTWLALGAMFWLASFPLAYPSSHEGNPSRVAFELPVRGAWRVRFAGNRRETNPWVLTPDRRFGVVLQPAEAPEGDAGSSHEVLAPADGRVLALVPVSPDSDRAVGTSERSGRTLILEVGEGEFLFLGPLEPAVDEGTEIRSGQRLGGLLPGPSGNEPGPLLALHLQDTAEPGWGEGIPIRFHGLRIGGESVALAPLRQGQEVFSEVPQSDPEPR